MGRPKKVENMKTPNQIRAILERRRKIAGQDAHEANERGSREEYINHLAKWEVLDEILTEIGAQ